jgi:hypothetical protein
MNTLAFQNTGTSCLFATVRVSSNGSAPVRRSRALAHVPFAFVVGDQVLEAGAYSIEPSGMSGMLKVRRAGSEGEPVLVQAIRYRRRGTVRELLFYCQQNLYFLAQVVVGVN